MAAESRLPLASLLLEIDARRVHTLVAFFSLLFPSVVAVLGRTAEIFYLRGVSFVLLLLEQLNFLCGACFTVGCVPTSVARRRTASKRSATTLKPAEPSFRTFMCRISLVAPSFTAQGPSCFLWSDLERWGRSDLLQHPPLPRVFVRGKKGDNWVDDGQ